VSSCTGHFKLNRHSTIPLRLRISNTYYFSTTTIATRKRPNVTLYALCLTCKQTNHWLFPSWSIPLGPYLCISFQYRKFHKDVFRSKVPGLNLGWETLCLDKRFRFSSVRPYVRTAYQIMSPSLPATHCTVYHSLISLPFDAT
jgi:hypothetical protein